jgi:hypothetical protein
MSECTVSQDIESILARVRTGAVQFVTNFFPMPGELLLWIERGLRAIATSERFVVLARPEKRCTRLFFSGSQSELASVLPKAIQTLSRPCVVDLITNSKPNSEVTGEFSKVGFTPYVRLSRLARRGAFEFSGRNACLPACKMAVPGDTVEILGCLHAWFDAYADQIPSTEEILAAVQKGQIRVLRSKQGLKGFLWFEKRGATSLIRYWWVAVDQRGHGIGGKLMREYFDLTKECTRHLLWLRDNNESASACYRHYGYSSDGVQDYVMVLKG